MPAVVRERTLQRQMILRKRMWTLYKHIHLAGYTVLLPDSIAVVGFTQTVEPHLRYELIPVDDQDDEAPELLLSRSILLIYRIKQKCTGATLPELERPGQCIFLTFLRQLRVGRPFMLGQKVESDGFYIILHRINLRDDPLRCQLKGFHHTIFIRKHARQCGEPILVQLIPGQNDIFQHIRAGHVLIYLGADAANRILRRIGRCGLFIFLYISE